MASTDKGAPSPMARLATLRAPRDLSLGGRGLTRGGAIKRKFVPIIPSASKTEVIAPVEDNNHNSFSPPTKRHRRSEDQRSDRGQYNNRGRGRGRSSANLIQTKSTLEAVLQEWTINSKKEKIINPGFPAGPRRAKEEQVIGSVVSQRESEESLDYLEESTLRDEFFMLSIPKNEEPIPTMNPLALPPKQKYQAKVQKTQTQSHLSENKSGLHPETIYFVTLPNKLPGFPQQQQQQQQQKEVAPQNRRTNTIPGAPTTSEENAEEVGSLSNFSEGYIGKLRFRKSGKVELVLGDNVLTGKAGTAQCYQEAAMLDTRLNPPELINFGQVKHCLDFSPDLMSLILKEYKNITINNQGGEGSK